MNDLYGCAISEYLPYGRFQWLKNIDKFNIMSISEKSPTDIFQKLTSNILKNYMNYIMKYEHEIQ